MRPQDDERGERVGQLLHELCVDLGFCLPPPDTRRLRESPPAGPDAFTDAVLTAEDLDPAAEPELRARVLAVVTRHMREW